MSESQKKMQEQHAQDFMKLIVEHNPYNAKQAGDRVFIYASNYSERPEDNPLGHVVDHIGPAVYDFQKYAYELSINRQETDFPAENLFNGLSKKLIKLNKKVKKYGFKDGQPHSNHALKYNKDSSTILLNHQFFENRELSKEILPKFAETIHQFVNPPAWKVKLAKWLMTPR